MHQLCPVASAAVVTCLGHGVTRVAVVGGSGFIGTAVVASLRRAAIETESLTAPRIPAEMVRRVRDGHGVSEDLVRYCTSLLSDFTHVVNAAGVAHAAGRDMDELDGANAVLPRVLQAASNRTRATRMLHISSAGVQGSARVLTEDQTVAPFSPYTRSKAWGEVLLGTAERTVVYRPTSVHGMARKVTQALAAYAASKLSVVAGDGNLPTPQALVENVADAVVFTLLHEGEVPPLVLHPWEGMTTGRLLAALGGREPRRIPIWLAQSAVRGGMIAGMGSPRVTAIARRFELLSLGQAQMPGWLDAQGWRPSHDLDIWESLGRLARCR